WQEQTGYGYITRETLVSLGEPPVLDELRILLEGNPMSTALIDAKAVELATALKAKGVEVRSVKVPPPGQHPHQGHILASLRGFLSFPSLALVLPAILVAAVLNAILVRQVREIGIMKALGARSGQIGVMYGAQLLALGAASLAVGLPLGAAAAGSLARTMADTMNFTVTSTSIPAWVDAILIAAGLLLPVLTSLPAIIRASGTTVREALASFGTGKAFGARRLDRALTALGGLPLPYLLAVRNMFRHRGRLILSLALLSAGGGPFLSAVGVGGGVGARGGRGVADREDGSCFLVLCHPSHGRMARA